MKQLATVHVAGCWMRRESNESYKWAMKQFRPTAWANVMDPSLLPNNSVTGKDLALMNAFKQVFSESKHILCYVHIMHNFLQRLIKNMTKKAKLDNVNRSMWQKQLRNIIYNMAYNSSSKRLLQDYKQEYDPFVSQDGLCEDKGKDMKDYLDSMMAYRRSWVGYYVNNYMNRGNRTSNRVESTHSGIKRHNKTSSGSVDLVTRKN
ncbi:unnamed protein product [Mucor circinelloides]